MLTTPLLPTLGIPELLIVLVIVMIFFGVGKLPEIGESMGKALKGFKDAQSDLDSVASGEERIEAEIEEAEEKEA